ncbi:MAG: hypothetical protein KatS3mg091_204 [Patescibacteria group bacterium]|nr:MAG: hypothetical protein KatS3mg091_204 [Patescibacteria group bacterium]
MMNSKSIKPKEYKGKHIPLQRCPVCSSFISALPGTRDAVCKNCGFKDPCCE